MVSSLLIALALGAAPDVAVVPAPGTPIVAIQVVRHNVFDTDQQATSAWPYRWANALHVKSRESFIRSLLLFRVGDPLDPALLQESERLLRFYGAMNPVTVTARAVAGGAEITVETHDQWSTELGLNYGKAGSRGHYGLSLSEDNFLGLGKQVILDYRSDDERSFTTLKYRDPLFLGRRLRLEAEHRKASDGSGDELSFERPFYSLASPWAAGASWQRITQQEFLWSEGEKAVEGQVHRSSLRAWGGWRLPGQELATNRVGLAVFREVTEFTDWGWRDGHPFPDPDDRELQGLEVSWDHQVDRWRVIRGFQAWRAQEDLPLGPNVSVSLGLSAPFLGGDRRRLVAAGETVLGSFRDDLFTWVIGSAAGRLEAGGLANGWVHGEVGTAQLGDSGFRARAAFDFGHNLDRDWQLTLGADTGLRGWDPDTFDGTSRAVVNLEWRARLTGEVLHLGILGMSVFADAGRTWAPRVGPGTEGWRADAGLGLHVELTRASIARVVRVEVGFPLHGEGPVLLVSASPVFYQARRRWGR